MFGQLQITSMPPALERFKSVECVFILKNPSTLWGSTIMTTKQSHSNTHRKTKCHYDWTTLRILTRRISLGSGE
jgi:hypothetical protein